MRAFILIISCCFMATLAMAQSGVPQAMKYQSVARDKFGIELKNRKISIRISLISKKFVTPVTYYVESQQVMTNELGLFSVAIGEGTVVSGVFANVPWYTDDIWMNIDVKDQDWKPYENIASSRLLTVPYAFHSATTSHVMGVADGNLTNIWSLKGNHNINPELDKLGPIDSLDLKMITNDRTRLTIKGNGMIDIAGALHVGDSLSVDGDLIAKKNVYLNVNSGVTIAHGNTTFEQHVNLTNAALQSTAPTNGALVVAGGVGVGRNLNVGQAMTIADTVGFRSPQQSFSAGTGALVVAGGAGIGKTLNVGSALKVADTVSLASTQQSYTPGTGALTVAGGAGIGKTLNVGSALKVADTVSLTSTQQSYTTGTGALVVSGGAGIGKTLNVAGALKAADSVYFSSSNQSYNPVTGALVVNGGAGIGGNLNVAGFVRINGDLSFDSNLESTAYTNGALVIKGGVGIAKRLNVNGLATMNNGLNVISGNNYIANFRNTTNANGISIQVQNAVPGMANNFVEFRNQSGGVVGRIEGETLTEMLNDDDDYKSGLMDQDVAVGFAAIDEANAIFAVAQATATQIGSDASSTACVGLGACVTAPIPSLIVSSGANLVLAIANAAAVTAGIVIAVVQRQRYIDEAAAGVGVTYQSGAGDYAEYLPKFNTGDNFKPGDIVGIKDGKITLDTKDATQVLVISKKPIVLGNVPAEGNEANYEKVAFMGQVPVKVFGKVSLGDYIVPDNINDGGGRAIAPAKMQPADYKNIVGIAWSASTNEYYNYINVAVGLNANAVAKEVALQSEAIKKQATEIADLRSEMAKVNLLLNKIIAGDKDLTATAAATIPAAIADLPAPAPVKASSIDISSLPPSVPITGTDESRIIYWQLNKEQMDEIWVMAEQQFIAGGGNVSTHPFWKKYHADPAYQKAMKQMVSDKINKELIAQKIINRQYSKAN